MRRVLYTYLFAYAALSASAVVNVAHADSEASVETHISGSSQMSVQVGNTVQTSSSSGGSVQVHIETIENGVKKTSEFRKTLAPGESFRYATSVESTSPNGSASVRSETSVGGKARASVQVQQSVGTGAGAMDSVRAAAQPPPAATSPALSPVLADGSAEPRAPSRLLAVIQHVRAVLFSLFSWW